MGWASYNLLAAALAALTASASCAVALGAEWSFEEHPHFFMPDYKPAQIGEMLHNTLEMGVPCQSSLDMEYEMYLETYPAFAPFAMLPGMRERWRAETVLMKPGALICPYADLVHAVVNHEPDQTNPLSYCGQFSRSLIAGEEPPAVKAIKDLVTFSIKGEPRAAAMLMRSEAWYRNVRPLGWDKGLPIVLNNDLEYALRLWLFKKLPGVLEQMPPYNEVKKYEKRLSPERKIFVDRAIAEDDLGVIFATTPPCPPQTIQESELASEEASSSIASKILRLLSFNSIVDALLRILTW